MHWTGWKKRLKMRRYHLFSSRWNAKINKVTIISNVTILKNNTLFQEIRSSERSIWQLCFLHLIWQKNGTWNATLPLVSSRWNLKINKVTAISNVTISKKLFQEIHSSARNVKVKCIYFYNLTVLTMVIIGKDVQISFKLF